MTSLLARMAKDPIGFMKRAFYKLVTGRARYGAAHGYDARRYWQDRLSRYGVSLKGPGHEGLSEVDNKRMYAEAAQIFCETCSREGVRLHFAQVLDIGCGSGFYTRLCRDLGVTRYTGLDITDVLFPSLRKEFAQYSFARQDITVDRIDGVYDLVLMIDVAEHIVEEDELDTAMANVRRCLSDDGLLMLALPLKRNSPKPLFYLRFWSVEDIRKRFPSCDIGEPVPFRDGSLLTIRKAMHQSPGPGMSETDPSRSL